MIKIDFNKGVCHIDGDLKEVLQEWAEATKTLYKAVCRSIGTGKSNEMFVTLLMSISKDAVDEIKEEENTDGY